MHTHGHATVWGTHVSFGRTKDHRSVLSRLFSWLTSKVEKSRNTSVVCHGVWDAQREKLSHPRADAALEIAAARSSFAIATMLYTLPS